MSIEEKDVNEADETVVEPSDTEEPKEPIVSEDGKTQAPDEKDYRTLYENAKRAIQEKNRKIQELKTPKREEQDSFAQQEEPEQDEGVKRFLRTEADAYIARKAVTDRSFMELLPEIEALVEQGVDIRTAEQRIKASMFESISQAIHREPEIPPTQLTPKAEQEPPKEKEKSLADTDPMLFKALQDIGF